jgi:hypothetical protein
VDLFINAVLTASSVALFCYWFRYGCLLILASEMARDYSEEVAEANRLSFPEVRSRLRKHDVSDLDSLHQCLEADLAIIAYLLEHTPTIGSDTRLEEAMLKVHYRTMSAWFLLTRSLPGETAARALEEMSRVVAHLANQLGERKASFACI